MKTLKHIFAGAILGASIGSANAIVTYKPPEAIPMTIGEIQEECEKYGIKTPFVLEHMHESICMVLDVPKIETRNSRWSVDPEKLAIPLTTLIAGSGILYIIISEIQRRKIQKKETGNPLDFEIKPQVRSRVEPGKKRAIFSGDVMSQNDTMEPISQWTDTIASELVPLPDMDFANTLPVDVDDSEEITREELLNELIGSYIRGEEISEEGKRILITGLVSRTIEINTFDEGKLRDIFLLAELEPKTIPDWVMRIEESLTERGDTFEDGIVGSILSQIREHMSIGEREVIFQELAQVCKIEPFYTENEIMNLLSKYERTGYKYNGSQAHGINFQNIRLNETSILNITLRSDGTITATIEDPIMKTKDAQQVDLRELEKIIAGNI